MAVENQGSDLGISNTIRVRESIVADPSYLSRGALRGAPPDLTLGVGDNEIAQQLADAFGQNFDYTSVANGPSRSEEHTSELQSLMRISYAVFSLKKKKHTYTIIQIPETIQ